MTNYNYRTIWAVITRSFRHNINYGQGERFVQLWYLSVAYVRGTRHLNKYVVFGIHLTAWDTEKPQKKKCIIQTRAEDLQKKRNLRD